MKKLLLSTLLTILVFYLNISVCAQNPNPKEIQLNKNAIYINGGVEYLSDHDGTFAITSFYMERIIKQKMWDVNLSSYVRIGIGFQFDYEDSYKYIIAQYGLLTGSNAHHLEVAAGLNYNYNEYFNRTLPFSINIGWRFQKPAKHLILRVGTGSPEILYFGFGFSF